MVIRTNTNRKAQLICPVAERDESEEIPNRTRPPCQRFDIDVYKLAKSISFNLARVPQVMEDYETQGEGRLKSSETIQYVTDTLITVCALNQEQLAIRRSIKDQIDDIN